MKKISFLILIFCTQNLVLAQKKLGADDWAKILSGKIETYQAYNIKTIKLSNNGKIIKQIDYNPATNKLTANGEKDTVTYVFDKENRLVNANFSQSWYTFNYLGNDKKANSFELKMDEDTLQNTRTISYPYLEKPKIEWFEVVKKSKKTGKTIFSSSKKHIINPKDSLWNYEETNTNKNFYRRFYNGASSQLRYISDKEYSYDSTYIRPNGIRFAKYEIMKNDSLWRHISVGDSVNNYHFKSGKLYKKQLIIFKENQNYEYYYHPETGKLMEIIVATYFLEKYGNRILWKKEYHNLQTLKMEITYPNKKYFKLRNNLLVERKKWNWNWFKKIFITSEILGCGTTSYSVHASEKKPYPYYVHNIASTSIIVDISLVFREIDLYDFDEEFEYNDVKQSYIHSEISLTNFKNSTFSGMYKTGKIPRGLQYEMQRIGKRFVKKVESLKNYKLEITTQDNIKFECEPYQYLNQIQLPIDVFSYRDRD